MSGSFSLPPPGIFVSCPSFNSGYTVALDPCNLHIINWTYLIAVKVDITIDQGFLIQKI